MDEVSDFMQQLNKIRDENPPSPKTMAKKKSSTTSSTTEGGGPPQATDTHLYHQPSVNKNHTFDILKVLSVAIIALAMWFGTNFDGGLFSSSSSSSSSTRIIDGMDFPDTIKINGATQSLVGGGTRTKWSFKVYTVGIYSDIKIIQSLKKKYHEPMNNNGDKVNNKLLTRDFSDSKLSGGGAKTLLLQFRREVSAPDMVEALSDALVTKIGKDKSIKFSEFILNMAPDRLTKGTNFYISCKGEKLISSLNNNNNSKESSSSSISIKGLCTAIFDVYLGNNPVSQAAKDGFEQGFADMNV